MDERLVQYKTSRICQVNSKEDSALNESKWINDFLIKPFCLHSHYNLAYTFLWILLTSDSLEVDIEPPLPNDFNIRSNRMMAQLAVQSSTRMLCTMLFCSETLEQCLIQKSPFTNWKPYLAIIASIISSISFSWNFQFFVIFCIWNNLLHKWYERDIFAQWTFIQITNNMCFCVCLNKN